MKIEIETIPHKTHRYETVGDWYDENGVLKIKVSEEVGDWRSQALIAVHELIEVLICKHAGVSQESVDQFDMQFEKEREEGKHSAESEPGDESLAPYYKQHQIATGVERILAAELGVDWNAYADAIESL